MPSLFGKGIDLLRHRESASNVSVVWLSPFIISIMGSSVADRDSLDKLNNGCRTDLIKAVVNYMKHPDRTLTTICCSTLAEIIRSDVHGHRTLDVRAPCY